MGPGPVLDLLSLIERSALGEWVRLTPHLYPVLMSLHVLGIAILVGPAVAADLRLLGVGRNTVPVTVVMRYLLPLSWGGFAVVAVTGAMMFAGVAVTVGTSAAAPWKLGLLAVAGVNVALFHAGIYRTVHLWDMQRMTPWPAKMAAVISLAAWCGTVFAGRFLAY